VLFYHLFHFFRSSLLALSLMSWRMSCHLVVKYCKFVVKKPHCSICLASVAKLESQPTRIYHFCSHTVWRHWFIVDSWTLCYWYHYPGAVADGCHLNLLLFPFPSPSSGGWVSLFLNRKHVVCGHSIKLPLIHGLGPALLVHDLVKS
jgi:hypothetical protein